MFSLGINVAGGGWGGCLRVFGASFQTLPGIEPESQGEDEEDDQVTGEDVGVGKDGSHATGGKAVGIEGPLDQKPEFDGPCPAPK